MANGSIDELVKALVAKEVESQLKKYTEAMNKLSQAVKSGAVAGVAAAPKADKPRRAAKPIVSDAAKAAVVKYQMDQIVSYKQGRGSFNAKVIGIDVNNGLLKVQRLSDNKVVDRPADKVYAAEAETVAAAAAVPAEAPAAAPAPVAAEAAPAPAV